MCRTLARESPLSTTRGSAFPDWAGLAQALVQPSSWRRMGLRWTATATSISARCRGPTGRKLSETSHGRIICARCTSSGRWYRSVNAQPTKFDLVIKPDYREGARPHGAAKPARPRRRGDRVMKRHEFITLLGGAAAWPLAARAQQPKKIPRLCFLTFDPGTFQSRSARFEPFFIRLNELGYVDGQTINIDYLSAEGRNDRFAEIAAECLRFK